LESPVALVDRAFLNPAADKVDLLLGEYFVELCGRHVIIDVRGQQSFHHRALLGVAWDDGGIAGLPPTPRGLEGIQAELTLGLRFVGTVTREAGVREDGPDVTVKLDAVLR